MKKLAFIFSVALLTACGGASETTTEETSTVDSTMTDTSGAVSPEEKEVEEISTPMNDSTVVDSSEKM